MKLRKLVSLALALCLMVSMLAVTASAASVNVSEKKRWNIMLVVDGSGSLRADSASHTDPDNLRFQALDMLIHQLQSDGNYVGVIVFNANHTGRTDEQSMRSGLAVNTEMVELTYSSKQDIIDAYTCDASEYYAKGAYYSLEGADDTDFGTALLVAQEKLSAMDNGLDSAIFLFTDGSMDVSHAIEAQALANKEQAIDNIYNEGITLCGVFLNKDGLSQNTEVRELVAGSLGVDPASYLGELYVEIQNAADLPDAIDNFSTVLGFDVGDDEGSEIHYSSFEKEFRIPGVGVEEVNIRLRSVDGKNLPEDMVVSITRPDGSTLSAGDMAMICASSDTYRMYKLTAPESGVWKFKVVVPENNSIGIRYNPIMSFYIGSQMEVTPDPATLHVNSSVTVSAYLEQNGNKLTDPGSYNEYTCVLEMKEQNATEWNQQVVTPDSNGNYTHTFTLEEYGIYDVRVSFVCGDLSVTSGTQTWNLQNHKPECSEDVFVDLMCGLFQQNEQALDLSEAKYRISDVEDAFQNLTISLDTQNSTCDLSDVSIAGGMLNLDARTCGNGSIVVTVADTQGETQTMTVHMTTENVTLKIVIAIVIALLIIALIVWWRIVQKNKLKTEGSCAITVWIPRGDTGDGQDICCTDLTPPGGQNTTRKQSLYEMLKRDMDDSYGSSARQACKDNKVKFSDYKDVIDEIQTELKRATVESVIYKDKKTKRKSSNQIAFKYKNVKQNLKSGGSVTVTMDGIRVSFSYSTVTSGGPDEDWGGSGGDWDTDVNDFAAAAKPKNKSWDDSDDFGGDPFDSLSGKNGTPKSSDADPWGTPAKAADDWAAPVKENDAWGAPAKEDDVWGSGSKKADSWDAPSGTTDSWGSSGDDSDPFGF